MAFRPTVIGVRNYRRELASLSVVKERVFRVHRNVPVALELIWRDLLACLPAWLSGDFVSSGFESTNPETLAPEIKNPALSAGHSHQLLRVALREARQNATQCS